MPCLSCGEQISPLRKYKFKSQAFKNVYKDRYIYRCRNCSLKQADISNVNESLLIDYYRSAYRQIAKIVKITDVSIPYYKNRAAALIKLLQQHHPSPINSAFEVGAGYGFNIKALKAAYPTARAATDEIDETIFDDLVGIDRGNLKDGPFDAILLSHVIEHFTDPTKLLKDVADALAPNGVVIVEIPNDIDGIIPITDCDEPHITFFTTDTFQKFAAGLPSLKIAELFTAGPDVRTLSLKTSLRELAKTLIFNTPILKQVAVRDKVQRTKEQDFALFNSRGVFLRAAFVRAQDYRGHAGTVRIDS